VFKNKQMKDSEISLLSHTYDNNTMVEIPGALLYSLMQILQSVKENETTMGFNTTYVKSSKEIFDKERKMSDGSPFLNKVDQDFEGYPTAESWFSQKPQEHVSMLGCGAMDLLMLIQKGHLENIKAGLTKEVGAFTKEEDEIKLS
jgi:hypothetical protein